VEVTQASQRFTKAAQALPPRAEAEAAARKTTAGETTSIRCPLVLRVVVAIPTAAAQVPSRAMPRPRLRQQPAMNRRFKHTTGRIAHAPPLKVQLPAALTAVVPVRSRTVNPSVFHHRRHQSPSILRDPLDRGVVVVTTIQTTTIPTTLTIQIIQTTPIAPPTNAFIISNLELPIRRLQDFTRRVDRNTGRSESSLPGYLSFDPATCPLPG
jgi:hypothetical protein